MTHRPMNDRSHHGDPVGSNHTQSALSCVPARCVRTINVSLGSPRVTGYAQTPRDEVAVLIGES